MPLYRANANAALSTFSSPTYDALGRLTSWIDGETAHALTYDALGRVATESVPGLTLTATYDPLGRMESFA